MKSAQILHLCISEPVVTSETKEEADEDEDEEEKEEEKQEETLPDPNQSPAEVAGPRLEQLWSYSCDLTSGHSVSSMAWNKVNPVSPKSSLSCSQRGRWQ